MENNNNLDIIPEESRSTPFMEINTKEGLKQKLEVLKQLAKKDITPDLENEFCNLLQNAIKLYDDEMKYEVAIFYYEYGSLLLTKLENTSEIFGDLLQKKEQQKQNGQEQQQQQEKQENKNKMLEEIPEVDEPSKANTTNSVNQQQQQQNQEEEKGNSEKQQQQQQQQSENPIVFQDKDVQIVDETPQQRRKSSEEIEKKNEEIKKQEKQEQQLQKPAPKNPMEEDEEEAENFEKQKQQQQQQQQKNNQQQQQGDDEENADDMQVLYENLYTALRIAEKEYEKIKRTNTDEQIKNTYDLKNVVVFLSDVSKRLGEFENWREKYDDSLELFKKSKEYISLVEDTSVSRYIAELEFLMGTTELYKESDEVISIQHFINAIIILENVLSKICKLPQKQFPDAKIIQQKDLDVEHLKISFMDSEESREVKEILPTLYNKLEDTILQRDQKSLYQAEQQKMKQQQQQNTAVFQPVDASKVVVKQLGVLGNAKKRKAQQQQQDNQNQNQENINTQNNGNESQEVNEMQKKHEITPSKGLQAKLDEQNKQQQEKQAE